MSWQLGSINNIKLLNNPFATGQWIDESYKSYSIKWICMDIYVHRTFNSWNAHRSDVEIDGKYVTMLHIQVSARYGLTILDPEIWHDLRVRSMREPSI